MADKSYVCIAPVILKETFDNKYKSTVPKAVQAAFAKDIDKSSKLTTKAPSDKKAEGFYLVAELFLTQEGKRIQADLKLILADWPKKSMFASKSTKAATDVRNPAKIDSDVDLLIKDLLDGVLDDVIKKFEDRAS